MKPYLKTAQITLRGQTNGGIFYLLPNIGVKLMYLIPLLFLWRVLAQSGADVDMSLQQMLSYTYMNAILADMLVVQTFLSSWCYEGELQKLYLRPISIFGDVASETIGGWIPNLLFFSLPLLCIAPLFHIAVIPASLWFFPSLILSILLGFAIDFIFACITIYMHGISWLSHVIRMAITALFSGTVIPFRLLPFGLEKFFSLQPFGSLGGAPLSIFVGTADPIRTILIQLFWTVLLMPTAIFLFKKSQEEMVSFGG